MIAWLQSTGALLLDIARNIGFADIIDMLIVAVLIYQVLRMTRETRANQVLKGVALMLIASWAVEQAGFTVLGEVFKFILSTGAILMVVLFQPELRRAMEQLGRGTFFEGVLRPLETSNGSGSSAWVVDELIAMALHLSERKVGALVVIQQKTALGDVTETGTIVDARVSAQLLENIFEPNTPLHDGAVIISGERVVAAACFLTLTDDSGVSRELGTRHRAGLGVTEQSDSVVIIVSEETGTISLAQGGRLKRYLDEARLREALEPIYGVNAAQGHRLDRLGRLIRRGKANG